MKTVIRRTVGLLLIGVSVTICLLAIWLFRDKKLQLKHDEEQFTLHREPLLYKAFDLAEGLKNEHPLPESQAATAALDESVVVSATKLMVHRGGTTETVTAPRNCAFLPVIWKEGPDIAFFLVDTNSVSLLRSASVFRQTGEAVSYRVWSAVLKQDDTLVLVREMDAGID